MTHTSLESAEVPVLSTRAVGFACGVGAGALWGLVFLGPELVAGFSPLQLGIGRYLCYGLFAALLIAPRWSTLRRSMDRRRWARLFWLALVGNSLYYVMLASAVQLGGIAMTALVVGFLPVVVTLAGSRQPGAVAVSKLLPSLGLAAFGAMCIGVEAWSASAQAGVDRPVLGLLCALGALLSWASFALGNARCLQQWTTISGQDLNLLVGVVTGVQSLLLIPIAAALDRTDHSTLQWLQLGAVSLVTAVLASILGNALWNRMSQLLPLTLVGQMIVFETLFALIYGLIWEQRWPSLLEVCAFLAVVLSVLSGLAAHRNDRQTSLTA